MGGVISGYAHQLGVPLRVVTVWGCNLRGLFSTHRTVDRLGQSKTVRTVRVRECYKPSQLTILLSYLRGTAHVDNVTSREGTLMSAEPWQAEARR